MAYPAIAPFPTTPSRSNPQAFADDADDFLAHIPDFAADVNAFGAYADLADETVSNISGTGNSAITGLLGVYAPLTVYQPGDCVFYQGSFWVALTSTNGISLSLDFISQQYSVQSGAPEEGTDWKQIRTIDGGLF